MSAAVMPPGGMTRWNKIFLATFTAALLLTVAWRFIDHSDREYSYWIDLHRQSVAWLEARCAELHTPGACGTAQERRAFLMSLEDYRDRVNGLRRPVVVLTALAWLAALASLAGSLRQTLRGSP